MHVPVFDGHNDALSRLWTGSSAPVADFAQEVGHVNAPACARGAMRGGFFALYSPSRRAPFDLSRFRGGMPDMPLPAPLDEGFALQSAIGEAGIALALEAAGHLRIVRTSAELAEAWLAAPVAAVLHLEGADCIGPDLLALDVLHALGLRSIGPVWSRRTIFGEGVPFRSGPDGDTGPGVTADGRRLLDRCRDLGLIVDTSHMTLRGFWDVAEAGFPLVATHSNACAILPATRNLTDDQLRAVGETGGMVGLNFGTLFLDENGTRTGRTGLDACIRQLAHMIDVAGEDHVGLGSDFDGAPMPDRLEGAGDLQNLVAEMDRAGFGPALVEKLCNGNWRRFLARALPQ